LRIQPKYTNATVLDIVYAPPYTNIVDAAEEGRKFYTVIGTPQQTQDGVTFNVLLDPKVNLWSLIKLESVTLSKVKIEPNARPPMFDGTGLYVVLGITHHGDTRGDTWLTELCCATRRTARIIAGGGLMAR
jgi:hypothetical protein